jgi:hypothetical protein
VRKILYVIELDSELPQIKCYRNKNSEKEEYFEVLLKRYKEAGKKKKLTILMVYFIDKLAEVHGNRKLAPPYYANTIK